MTNRIVLAGLLITAFALPASQLTAADVGSGFTYQGELLDDGSPVTDTCDFEFSLWDDSAAGGQVGNVIPLTIGVDAGRFDVLLDFGVSAFAGEARWLQVDVCCASPCAPALTTLLPRQELTPVPYAIHADAPDGHSLDASDGDPVDAVFVDPNGHVGIGTTAPARTLHIQDSAGAIRVDSNTNSPGIMFVRTANSGFNTVWKTFGLGVKGDAPGSGSFSISDKGTAVSGAGAKRLVIDTDGNVGIGTETPTELLGVAGNIHASGTIASGDSITIDGTPGAERIASSDALEMHTSTGRVMRLEPEVTGSTGFHVAPNVLTGWEGNAITAGVAGATISGGGASHATLASTYPNTVTDDFGTIGGGQDNQVGDDSGTTSDANYATVAGGLRNTASGYFSSIAGGTSNEASAMYSAVGAGRINQASGTASTIGGGMSNTASGSYSTIPGGLSNDAAGDYSFATGRRAKANHVGTFVWGDSTDADFASTGADQLLIRASGGVGIGTNAPTEQLDVAGNTHIDGDLIVDGAIIGSIDVSQITGLLGDGFRLQFPDVIDNLTTVDVSGAGVGEAVIITGPGYDIERVPGFNGQGDPDDTPGFAMEHPYVFETSGTYASDLQLYFDNFIDPASSAIRPISMIIDRLDGTEAFRWNFYEFAPEFYEPGTDGRTRFHLRNWLLPDISTHVEAVVGPGSGDPFGDAASFNPATDSKIEIEGIPAGVPAFYPQVAVDEADRTITLTYDFVEGKGIWDWVQLTIEGNPAVRRSLSWIQDPGPPEVRRNYYGCFPIRYEQFTGFGLDTKIKARVVLSFNVAEDV